MGPDCYIGAISSFHTSQWFIYGKNSKLIKSMFCIDEKYVNLILNIS